MGVPTRFWITSGIGESDSGGARPRRCDLQSIHSSQSHTSGEEAEANQ